MNSSIDPNATKYMVKAKITADGVVDKPDVVGAIFGQTEGLLGDDLDLRDLQKSGRIGRIEVEVATKGGKSEGIVYMSSSLDQVESAILAAALETIDRVGPCKASIKVIGIEDVRITKRDRIVERAKELLTDLVEQARGTGANLALNVRSSVQVEEITTFGPERCPAGPNVKNSDAIIIVEGRSDVLNLLRAGIKNAVAVEGTNIPKSVQDLSREKVTTAFVDGDRGGELILRELFQTSEVDFVARAPRAHEVEELSAKQLVKCLRNKVPGDQYMEMNNLRFEETELGEEAEKDLDGEERRSRRPRDYEDGEDDFRPRHERGGRDRHGRRDDDEEDGRRNRRDRHARRDDESRNGRFNNDAADRFRKKNRRDYDDSEEDISEQTVDTIPVRCGTNGPEDVPAERHREPVDTAEEPDAEEPAQLTEDAVPETAAEETVQETVQETAAEETVQETAVPAEEEPAAPEEEPAEEPAEEEPKREIRPNKRDARTPRGKGKTTKILSEEQEKLRDILRNMTGTHNAVLLNAEFEAVEKIEVKKLADYLGDDGTPEGIVAVVSDGVIGQNLIDRASKKNITTLVGKKKGKITKLPSEISVWVKDDLD